MKKRILCAMFAVVMLVGLFAGCSSPAYEAKTTEERTTETEVIPAEITNFAFRLQTASEKNNIPIVVDNPRCTKTTGDQFEIEITSIDGSENSCSLNYYSLTDLSPSMSFSLPKDAQFIRNIITALFISLNGDAIDEAQNKTQNLVNSVHKGKYSDVVDCGDYLLFIGYEEYGTLNAHLYLQHKEHIWDDVNKSDYPPIDYAMYQAPALNNGTNVTVSGTVISWECEAPGTAPFANIYLNGDDGNKYTCSYAFVYSPVIFNKGQHITVYGVLAGTDSEPLVRADYVEYN